MDSTLGVTLQVTAPPAITVTPKLDVPVAQVTKVAGGPLAGPQGRSLESLDIVNGQVVATFSDGEEAALGLIDSSRAALLEVRPSGALALTLADGTTVQATNPVAQKVHRHPWSDLDDVPATFAPSAHTHPTTDITGLDATLAALFPDASGVPDGKVLGLAGGEKAWIDGVPQPLDVADSPAFAGLTVQGNVLVGTTTDTGEKLQVAGDAIKLTNGYAYATITADSGTKISLRNSAFGKRLTMGLSGTTPYIDFETDNRGELRIGSHVTSFTSSGMFGIGTADPAARLTVAAYAGQTADVFRVEDCVGALLSAGRRAVPMLTRGNCP